MQLQNGRPTDTTGRPDKEIRTYDFLDKLGIEYQRIDHEAAFTMEVCEEIDKTLGATICKNLFLCNRQKTDFYLLMIPGDKTFKTKALASDRQCETFVCKSAGYGKISGYHTGLSQCDGTDERP